MTEDEMVGKHHQLSGHEFVKVPVVDTHTTPTATASAMSYTPHNAATSHTGFHIHLSGLVLEA